MLGNFHQIQAGKITKSAYKLDDEDTFDEHGQMPPMSPVIKKESGLKPLRGKILVIVLLTVIAFLGGCIIFMNIKVKSQEQIIQQLQENFEYLQPSLVREILALKGSHIRQDASVPKLLWLYTNPTKMLEELLINYNKHKARQSGFELRLVDARSAYRYLSNETTSQITKVMQNKIIEEEIDNLLSLALLKEHGGILIRVEETLLIDDFDWLDSYIRVGEESSLDAKAEVVLFSESMGPSWVPQYQDFFIAATKQATLVVQTFELMCQTLLAGKGLFLRLKEATYINERVNSTRIRDLRKNLLHSLLEFMTPQFYATKVINTDVSRFNSAQCRDNLPQLLKKSPQVYESYCGEPNHMVHFSPGRDRGKLEDELEWQLTNEVMEAHQKSYWYSWMIIPQNRRLFQPLPPRQIQYCLIDAHPSSDLAAMKASAQRLKYQQYKHWSAIYFVDKNFDEHERYAEEQRQQGYNLSVVNHTGSVGRNYEVGIIRCCPSKSFVVVLRRDERLDSNQALAKLTETVLPRPVLGAFVGVNTSGVVRYTDRLFEDYEKYLYNGGEPQYDNLEKILNYLRVFHSDCYKIIPQFDLRTPEGIYFNDRFVFLQQFLYMVRNLTQIHDITENPHTQRVKWYIKSNADIFDVPNRIANHTHVLIRTNAWEEVDRAEIVLINNRIDSYAMTYNMQHLVGYGIPMSEFAVYNPGLEYEPYTVRSKPQLIPKIIHEIWIGGKMPQLKQKVRQMNQQLYPDFEFKLWGRENITKQQFPYSYDLLMTLEKIESISRYSKRATMADVLRHEIMYNEGGFYLDTNMILFNNKMSQWLSYKLAMSTERTFRHRWSQSMCIYGAMPRFEPHLRVISHYNMNNYNIWLRDALDIAGPHDFRWLVRGMEEYDPDYLIIDYDGFYPMAYQLPSFYETYCFIQPEYLSGQDEIVGSTSSSDRKLIKNCGKYYPNNFGKEINNIGGGTWIFPKW